MSRLAAGLCHSVPLLREWHLLWYRLINHETGRRFERWKLPPDGAPEFSYYLNYNGLDSYNSQGVTFIFDRATKKFHYEGRPWREIVQVSEQPRNLRRRVNI